MKSFLLLLVLKGECCTRIHAFAAPNSRLEAAAIKRFREYDKLCKTCPTTLKPRVDTLTEMIVGLTDEEREELWSNVASRLQAQQIAEQDGIKIGVKTPEEVYKFQTGVDPASKSKEKREEVKMEPTLKSREPLKEESAENESSKLVRKMNKMRSKLQDAKAKKNRIQRLLHQTQSLLSNKPLYLNNLDETDSAIYHSIDELEQMNSRELKYARLKYIAQRNKADQKISKYRLKLYGMSLELAKQEQSKELFAR